MSIRDWFCPSSGTHPKEEQQQPGATTRKPN